MILMMLSKDAGVIWIYINKKKAEKIFDDCINEMYENSIPPTTWIKIKEKYGNSKKTFYDKHYINEDKYNAIKDKYYKMLDKFYRRQLDWFLFDYAPSFKKKSD